MHRVLLKMPKYTHSDSDESDEDQGNAEHVVVSGIPDKNHIILYLSCKCVIVSPVDTNTIINSSYHCDFCDRRQSVFATVRHLSL